MLFTLGNVVFINVGGEKTACINNGVLDFEVKDIDRVPNVKSDWGVYVHKHQEGYKPGFKRYKRPSTMYGFCKDVLGFRCCEGVKLTVLAFRASQYYHPSGKIFELLILSIVCMYILLFYKNGNLQVNPKHFF